jgi:hypothetical protein
VATWKNEMKITLKSILGKYVMGGERQVEQVRAGFGV